MGSITRSFANNITTSGVLLPASLTNNSIANVTAYNAAIATGGMKLISSQTASASASISFTTGIDSTYKEYQFYFINIHPASNAVDFTFNLSTNGGSTYAVTKTTTSFRAFHQESGATADVTYVTEDDLAQSTAFQLLSGGAGGSYMYTTSDEHLSGSLILFNPSSTTYVKHFIATTEYPAASPPEIYPTNTFIAGYGNTTSAINAIQFKMSSGNIDDGTILMYGIV
jgi:hypothetical protein